MLRTLFAPRIVARVRTQCRTCEAQPEYTVTVPLESAATALRRLPPAAMDAVHRACGEGCQLSLLSVEVNARVLLDDDGP